MANASQEVGNICTLGEVDPQSPHLHVRRELHFLSPVALVEVLNRVHRTVRRQAVQIQQMIAQIKYRHNLTEPENMQTVTNENAPQ